MMEMLFGRPFVLIAIGIVLSALLILMYFQTNDLRLKPFIFGAVLLTLIPIATDTLVTTSRESIQMTLGRLTRSVRMNDVPATLTFAHPDSKMVYDKIAREMPTYKFSMCNVAGLHSIEWSEDSQDAVVKFTVLVNVQADFGPEGFGNRGITLNMRKDSAGDWKIMDYQHYPPVSRNRDSKLERY